MTSFKFKVVPCRIRLFPTLILKIKWLEPRLPLKRTHSNLTAQPGFSLIKPNPTQKKIYNKGSTNYNRTKTNLGSKQGQQIFQILGPIRTGRTADPCLQPYPKNINLNPNHFFHLLSSSPHFTKISEFGTF